jgi:rfaE bifunctional protein nucleotidyltransferase chain/domain
MKPMSPHLIGPTILTMKQAGEVTADARKLGMSVTLTNGCFDVLHVGHLDVLKRASKIGHFLIVGVNCDESVRELKGPGRPRNSQRDRMSMLIALRCVDFVFPFRGPRFNEAIDTIRPNSYAKGGDYVDEGGLDPSERDLLDHLGVKIFILPKHGNYSTTNILNVKSETGP